MLYFIAMRFTIAAKIARRMRLVVNLQAGRLVLMEGAV